MTPPEAGYSRSAFLSRVGRLAAAAASGPLLLSGLHARTANATTHADDPIAANALRAARQFKGASLTFSPWYGWERPDEEASFAAQWTELTGVQVGLDPASPDVFEEAVEALPDSAERGAIAPLDRFIVKHGGAASLRDYHPLNRTLTRYRGKTWGFLDDGDVWPVFYRKDVFADPKLRDAYRESFGRDLRVPRTWPEFAETAQFITGERAPAVYGTSTGREIGPGEGARWYFHFHFQLNGGRFFDPESMRSTINTAAGVKAIRHLQAENAASIPSIEKLDFIDTFALWLQGRTALLSFWPLVGRLSENVERRTSTVQFLPRSKVAGKVGYTTMRDGAFTTGGSVQCVGAGSKHKEAAYLFAQWLTSPSVSLARLEVPITFRDPSRTSHYRAERLRHLWPTRALCESANTAVLPLFITGVWEYGGALNTELRLIFRGKDVQRGLDDAAAAWDRITTRLGVEKQRRSYQSFLQMTGSSRETTAAAKGLAVRC